ncbi:MAG: TolC family protein [Microscillaceae bacterium]|nr:TolC family protein [Microscillaceae bacterium]MDW8461604.1 TolC family protein [Cytophagales bacterium]
MRIAIFFVIQIAIGMANIFWHTHVLAQYKQKASANEKILTFKDFYRQIFEFHPIVKQAKLLPELARQEIRMARGQFDWKLQGEYLTKSFDKKNYYNFWDSYLKIPNWIGDFKVGHEHNSGVFLSEENKTPKQGLNYVGLTLPLLRGVIIDERRATLRQAQLLNQIAEAERIKIINKVLISATKDYWEWYFTYHQAHLLKEGLHLAQIRYDAVKQRIEQGDLAPIDSVEAKITLQDRAIQYKQALIELQNMRLILSNYFWASNETPLELNENVIPELFELSSALVSESQLQELYNYIEKSHPEVLKITYKIKQINIEEKLATNNLLPKVDFSYNFLNSTLTGGQEQFLSPFQQNYKAGIYVEIPLFLRKERGKLQQIRIKQLQANYDRTQTIREIRNELQAAYNNLRNLKELIDLQRDMVANYNLLRDAEQQKFEIGESTLFLVNSREAKLIEGKIKLESLKSKYEKEKLLLFWVAGVPLWEL